MPNRKETDHLLSCAEMDRLTCCRLGRGKPMHLFFLRRLRIYFLAWFIIYPRATSRRRPPT